MSQTKSPFSPAGFGPIDLEMANKWFVQKGEMVEGPMTTDDVQSRLASGQFTAMHMVWGRSLDGWIRLETWQQRLPQLGSDDEPTQIDIPAWHYAHGGSSYGPYTKLQLTDELRKIHQTGEVMVWTKGMKEWAPLFEFHDLLHALGVNKREYPRAELSGKAVLKTAEATLIAQLVTISEGGCSLRVDQGLVPGQTFMLEIQSAVLREVIHAKAECRYISEGVAGVKFTQLSSEAKAAIVQFVKQSQTRFVLKAA